MRRALHTTLAMLVLSAGAAGCQFGGTDPYELEPQPECVSDFDCRAEASGCVTATCESGTCKAAPVADGTPVASAGSRLQCQKLVCDGKGSTRNAPDPTAVPTDRAPSCKRYACDASGAPVLEADPTNVPDPSGTPCQRAVCDASGSATTTPDPNNLPVDTPNDCKAEQCDLAGNVTYVAAPTDLPVDRAGDCMKDTCGADGTFTKVVDDTDTPQPSTCKAHVCSNGVSTDTPINPTTSCSTAGYVCGADGECQTCPAPDAACTSPGPASRSQASAHDYGGIGRTDTGGRYACGAVPVGEREYYTYYDNNTGFLAEFDPYFELRPQAAATMCVYFDCPTVACPAGTTTDTLAAQPGCCWNAAAGSFTGKRIDFCSGARVTLAISSTAACTAYEMHFHD